MKNIAFWTFLFSQVAVWFGSGVVLDAPRYAWRAAGLALYTLGVLGLVWCLRAFTRDEDQANDPHD